MPWSATCPMDERARFVLEALEGWSSMSALCAKYGVSRRIGYKWLARYHQEGLGGLGDRSRAPRRQAEATPARIVREIVALRTHRPTWGPRKLRAWLARRQPGEAWPACSTIGAILRREGLSTARRRRSRPVGAWSPSRTVADTPNRVWTTDFKGEFRLGCGRLCYPLTIVDAHSRYLLECRALPSTAGAGARAVFERVFRMYGLPDVIRTDNGVPFSHPVAVAGLSRLAVWWIRLGIRLERIRKRHPEDNGAHERLHRTLKAEATRPARTTPELQQRAFNQFCQVYNEERPHEALDLHPPASRYHRSPRAIPRRLPPMTYPEGFATRRINRQGQLCWRRTHFFVSETLRGETVGLVLRDDGDWNIYFGPAHLAILNERDRVMRRTDGGSKRPGHRR